MSSKMTLVQIIVKMQKENLYFDFFYFTFILLLYGFFPHTKTRFICMAVLKMNEKST